MSVSRARELLRIASREPERLRRHLLVAAALAEILPDEPIVVGGTAFEYWAGADYHETDLDLCAPLVTETRRALDSVGFVRTGRHWVREGVAVAVEFPDSYIDGDESRTATETFGSTAVRIIGVEDLYLDRVRQATAVEDLEGEALLGALALAVAHYERIDWDYVEERIMGTGREEPIVGRSMRKIDYRVRTRARRSLTEPE